MLDTEHRQRQLAGYNPVWLAKVRPAISPKAARSTAPQPNCDESADRETQSRLRRLPAWVRDIVEEVAARRNRRISAIVGRSLVAADVAARNEVFYRVKSCKPSLSFPRIGAWFGRNHTSIMYAVSRHSHVSGEPPLSTYDLTSVRLANQRAAYWHRKRLRAALQEKGE